MVALKLTVGIIEKIQEHFMNPILGWLLYMNMNYHIEHHIFPTVPFYNLPKLHHQIKNQLPEPNVSFISGLFEMIPAIIKQSKDKNYYIPKLNLT